MKRKIHINQHVIKKNGKTGERNPPITVKTYKSNTYYMKVHIEGPCTVVYEPDKPLSCGAKVYIETESKVYGDGFGVENTHNMDCPREED